MSDTGRHYSFMAGVDWGRQSIVKNGLQDENLPDDIRECIVLLVEDIESENPAGLDEIEAAIHQLADYLGVL